MAGFNVRLPEELRVRLAAKMRRAPKSLALRSPNSSRAGSGSGSSPPSSRGRVPPTRIRRSAAKRSPSRPTLPQPTARRSTSRRAGPLPPAQERRSVVAVVGEARRCLDRQSQSARPRGGRDLLRLTGLLAHRDSDTFVRSRRRSGSAVTMAPAASSTPNCASARRHTCACWRAAMSTSLTIPACG